MSQLPPQFKIATYNKYPSQKICKRCDEIIYNIGDHIYCVPFQKNAKNNSETK